MSPEIQANEGGGSAAVGAATTVIGDRFEVLSLDHETPEYRAYRATDRRDGIPALVFVVSRSGSPAPSASTTTHRNLAAVLDVGVMGGHSYIAYEYHEGDSLRAALERKKRTGAVAFSPKAALNVVSHVAVALDALHSNGEAHGLIGIETVAVNKAGRVVIYGHGLSASLAGVGLPDWPTIAPELHQHAAAEPPSDVYSLGALIYYLLVGAHPIKGCKRPSEAVDGLLPDVDAVVGSAMHPQPASRYPSTKATSDELKRAVHASRQMAAQSSPPAGAQDAARRPSLAHEIVSAPDDAADSNPSLRVSAVLQSALADTDERYLINMGKLDYGPFSLQQVVSMIESDEILPGHLIIDKDTAQRSEVDEHPLLADLVHQAQERRDEQRRAAAEVAHASKEKRRGFTLYGFIVLGIVALSGGAYLVVSKLAAGDGDKGSAEIAAIEHGSLKVKINPISIDKRKRTGKRRGKRRAGTGGQGQAGGWDDSLDFDMAEGGGSERLDDSQINPVIQRHGGRLGRCLSKTGSRYADIDFIVRGNGKVSQVRVNDQTSGSLANCIRGAMTKMKFPSFNGPRTKANFNMSL